MAEIVNMNYIDWDHPLLEGQTLIQNLVKSGVVKAGIVWDSLYLTTNYIYTYAMGSTWEEALINLFIKLEGEFEELIESINSRKGW